MYVRYVQRSHCSRPHILSYPVLSHSTEQSTQHSMRDCLLSRRLQGLSRRPIHTERGQGEGCSASPYEDSGPRYSLFSCPNPISDERTQHLLEQLGQRADKHTRAI